MHYQDDMTGFLSELKGGGSATAAPPSSNPGPLMTAAGAAAASSNPSSLRASRSALNGLALPAFSGALSSSAGGAGPVSRTFSGLRSGTGEASIGSLNTGIAALHHPPSLSADPPLQPSPPRAPTSPIPHLHHSAFAQCPVSSLHTFAGSFSHLNASQSSSVARQALNYSPTPPHSNPTPVTAAQPPQSSAHPQRLPTPQPTPHASQQALMHRPPVTQPSVVSARARLHRPQDPPPVSYAAYAAPQPQAISAGYAPVGFVKLEQHQQQPVQTQLHPAQQPVGAATASAVTAVPLSSSDGGSQPEVRRQGSSRAPQKRARPASDRPAQLSPTTPRSAAGAGSGHYWGHQAASEGKGNTAAEGVSAPAEEQSRPERKREREKRRRETMNTRFSELAACLIISAGGKSDKESILAEAVDHVKKQAASIKDLEKQKKDLMAEAKSLREEKIELRQDKNYIREERDKYKEELDALKAEHKRRKRPKLDNGVKEDNQLAASAKLKEERINGIKAEVKA